MFSSDNSNSSSPTILIVDDNPKNLQILGSFLHNEGYKVEFALDGKAALSWIEQMKFDLILLDIMMPGMDGNEVCRIIKSHPINKKIPIIFLTAKVDTESIVNAFDLGAVDYIVKPFNQKELIARVKTQIEIKKSKDEIARNLKEIEYKSKLIKYSIQYALLIQSKILKISENGLHFFQEQFSLYLPKDIVSGDFYWFYKIDNKIFAGVFDCTGHGIPGAFMSILGVTLLNETVINEGIYEPHLILNRLRNKIIEAMGQEDINTQVKDGMDGSIICYDSIDKTLTYSGAYNPMYLIRDNTIKDYKADRMTMSVSRKMNDFTSIKIQIKPDDLIYLFTDGFIDQFGGQKEKKLKALQFKEALLKNHKETMKAQKEMLLDLFYNWKENTEQTDDVTVVGIRF